MADRSGLPLAVCTASALPHEVKLINSVLATKFVNAKPVRLVSDRAYDSGPLDESLNTEGIELIAPNKINRVKPPTQDGRMLRRIKRHWKIERLFSWMQNFRHLAIRYEQNIENLLGFINLVCILLLHRRHLRDGF